MWGESWIKPLTIYFSLKYDMSTTMVIFRERERDGGKEWVLTWLGTKLFTLIWYFELVLETSIGWPVLWFLYF